MSEKDVFTKMLQDLTALTVKVDHLKTSLNSKLDPNTHSMVISIESALQQTISDFHVQEYRIERALEKLLAVKQDLDLALQVQRTIFPAEHIYLRELHIAGFTKAARTLGGDYYSYSFSNTGIHAAIGDISGKGVGNALITLMVDNYYKQLIYQDITLTEQLRMLDQFFTQLIAGYQDLGQKFMTFLTFRFMEKLEYAGAGHEYILHFHLVQKQVERIKTGGMALGLSGHLPAHFSHGEIHLEPGDCLVTYSDGIPDTRTEFEERYGLDRLVELVENHHQLEPDALIQQIVCDVESFQGGHGQYDDLTLLIMKKPESHS